MASGEVNRLKEELKAEKKQNRKQNKVSPKVKYGSTAMTLTGLVITVLTQFQDRFGDFAGDFTPAVYMGVVVAVGSVASYITSDPNRVSEVTKAWLKKR